MGTVDLVVPSAPQTSGVPFTVSVHVSGASPGAQISVTVKQTRPRAGFQGEDSGTADSAGSCSIVMNVTLSGAGWFNLAAIGQGDDFIDVDAEAVKLA